MRLLSREIRQHGYSARRWSGRAVGALIMTVSVAACGLVNGLDEPTPPPETPLADETICGVFPNQGLQDILGLDTYRYRYSAGPASNVKTDESGYHYECYIRSNSDPFGLLDISYGVGTYLDTGSYGQVEFDSIPSEFPDTARETSFEGVEGEGWVWTFDVSIYVAWRYSDNQTLLARLTYWGPEEDLDEQVEKLHTILAPAIAQIPELASTTRTRVTVPSPTPEAEDAAAGNDD